MSKLKAVFLDAGNTILHLDFPFIAEVLSGYGVSPSLETLERSEAVARAEVDRAHVVGTTTDYARWFYYFRLIMSHAGLTSEFDIADAYKKLEARHSVKNLWCRVPPEVPAVLAELRSKYTIGVVSNADGRIKDLLALVGLLDYFSFVVDSGQVGVEKPDPRIFQHALAAASAEPDEVVHVGDLVCVDVAGAEASGIRAVLIDPFDHHTDALCARIRNIGELPAAIARLA
ncbi:MAG: HAD family hydrolase [Planctomycetota bacterium]|nr:HAD family hydrolase [Planctomycetota bacterium]